MSISKHNKLTALILLSCVVLTLASNDILAQQTTDNPVTGNQNIIWSASGDSTMSISENIRTWTLNENVKIVQGTLEILGDQAILEIDEPTGELIKATVIGTPVQYAQQLDLGRASVSGTSDSILLYTDENSGDSVVELIGNAHIASPDSTVNCAAIVYLPDLDLIPSTSGPCAGNLSNE